MDTPPSHPTTVPNLFFYGNNINAVNAYVYQFISNIYANNPKTIQQFVMFVNCAHGHGKGGIDFVREDLKFFAKSNKTNDLTPFKSVVLLNGDQLSVDAQSALRRCIELYCKTTRFFITARDKFTIMRPILSRFCERFIDSELEFSNGNANTNTNTLFSAIWTPQSASALAEQWYEMGIGGVDILEWVKTWPQPPFDLLVQLVEQAKIMRNEKVFMSCVIHQLKNCPPSSQSP